VRCEQPGSRGHREDFVVEIDTAFQRIEQGAIDGRAALVP
jgi:hypothetical protein